VPNKKVNVLYKVPSKLKIALNVLKALFSITFIKRMIYTFSYYLLNNIHGIIHINKGKNVDIRPNVMFRDPERIYIGDNSRINTGCKLWAGKVQGIIKIGKYVELSPNVMILAFNHQILTEEGPIINQTDYIDSDVIIGDNVWVGANTLILPGCNIGSGVVIAAGSIVTKDLPDNTLCAGVPAKVIKSRLNGH